MASNADHGARRAPAKQLVLSFLAAATLAFLFFSAAFRHTRSSAYIRGGGEATGTAAAGSGAAAAAATTAAQKGQQQGRPRDHMSAVQEVLQARVCGSPAVDGYAHVVPECLEGSPTTKWWQENKPGPDDLDIHIERGADYDGLAVAWGIGNTKKTVEECAEACRQHKPKGTADGGPFGNLPCNAFAYCPEEKCWEPDAHEHSKGDCWLKFTEAPAAPEVNMRGRLSKAQQLRHPQAPRNVQWQSGVLLPHGVTLTNGSWSPRHNW